MVLLLGEIQTCLLDNAAPLPRAGVTDLLALLPGRRVVCEERPVLWARSPEKVSGVDCRLAASKGRARGIGTVPGHAVVTGGMVLQGSVVATLGPAEGEHRRPWSYYVGREPAVDVIGGATEAALATGFLAQHDPQDTLDLRSLSTGLLDVVQTRPQLDHRSTLSARVTRTRWTARVEPDPDAPATATVFVKDEVTRHVQLTVHAADLPDAARFCEDLALHDWLLTTLTQQIELAERARSGDGEPIEVLAPVVTQLLHQWMPGGHVPAPLRGLWESLERSPGFTRQWQAQVARVRDWVALRTLQELQRVGKSDPTW